MKKVLVISGSPRKGNSDALCDRFCQGAKEVGHDVEKIRPIEKKLHYCTGCYACKKTGKCVHQDDMGEILQKIIEADVLVLSSPVYFYAVCAPLKTLIDRCVARWKEITDKEFYFIVTAAEDEDVALETTINCLRGFMECCENSVEKGVVGGKGVYELGEVQGTPYLEQAYQMGKSV